MSLWHTHPVADLSSQDLAWKRYMSEACPHGLLLVLVDGTHVRNTHDSDFCQGGNGFRYRFIPRGELWIDEQISEDEWPLIAFHECYEAELMRGGMDYDGAHLRAKMQEDRVRHAANPRASVLRAEADQLEMEAIGHQDRGAELLAAGAGTRSEENLAAEAFTRAAELRLLLGQRRRADQLRGLAIQAIKPHYGEFVDRPIWNR